LPLCPDPYLLGTSSHTDLEFDILDAKKCKEFASTISAIREPRTAAGAANFFISFRPELWRDISVGFGAFPIHGLSVKEVMTSIDAALYKAKRDGRDRVVVAEMVTTTDIKVAAAASSASEVRS
jgi:GGDEF domain-containing protein